MKQVLIYSIQPEHVLNFLKGLKSDEIRKRDLPQWVKEASAQGEVVEGYGYCTKGKQALMDYTRHHVKMGVKSLELIANVYELQSSNFDYLYGDLLNGKVVFKFQVSGVNKIIMAMTKVDVENYVMLDDVTYIPKNHYTDNVHYDEIPLDKMCLDYNQLLDYGNGADLYAHHFTNIQPIEPMGLREFMTATQWKNGAEGREFEVKELTKAPQSFMTAWVKGE